MEGSDNWLGKWCRDADWRVGGIADAKLEKATSGYIATDGLPSLSDSYQKWR